MDVIVTPDTLQLAPGAVVRLLATWHEYQHLANQRGDCSIPRIKYRNWDGTTYQRVTPSRYFPEMNLEAAIARCLQIAYERNTSAAIRDLRQQLQGG